jgi:DNA-directed RNA polymerase specialized sigma24 family protein
MTTKEYIEAFRRSDQAVIRQFYNRYRPEFFQQIGAAFSITDEDLLADIWQDSVIRLWQLIGDGKVTEERLGNKTLMAFLIGIGEKITYENLRKLKEQNLSDPDIQPEDTDEAIRSYDDRERMETIRETVWNMPDPCRQLLVYFYWDELDFERIAALMHYSGADSAKTQKFKCMKKLMAALKKFI